MVPAMGGKREWRCPDKLWESIVNNMVTGLLHQGIGECEDLPQKAQNDNAASQLCESGQIVPVSEGRELSPGEVQHDVMGGKGAEVATKETNTPKISSLQLGCV